MNETEEDLFDQKIKQMTNKQNHVSSERSVESRLASLKERIDAHEAAQGATNNEALQANKAPQQVAAKQQSESKSGIVQRFFDWLNGENNGAWKYATAFTFSLLAIQSVFMMNQNNKDFVLTSGGSPTTHLEASVMIKVNDAADFKNVSNFLSENQLSIVEGPLDNGMYRLAIKSESKTDAIQTIEASELIDFVVEEENE